MYKINVEIVQENNYKGFLKRYIDTNFTSYYKFHNEFEDFVKPSHLAQTLKTDVSGQFVHQKDISISKWTTWVNSLKISKKEKKHLILIRLRDELIKDLNPSSPEVLLLNELINQNITKKDTNSRQEALEILNKNRFNGNLFDIMFVMGHLSKNRIKYVKDTIKSCAFDEIASKPSTKTIELKGLLKKIL